VDTDAGFARLAEAAFPYLVGSAAKGDKVSVPLKTREKLLDRVRVATKSVAQRPGELADSYAALQRDYVRRGGMTVRACHERLIERLREYDAEVVEATPEELPAAIAAQLAASGMHKFVAPDGLPAAWLAEGFDWKLDSGLTSDQIEEAEGVVTGAFCAIADSGTIALHHSATEGRRVLTLLPDWHLIVLHTSQVVETLPEYFARCENAPTLATYISGPSATADIEMTRIKGVHGPRFLHVILVRDSEL
jgi:L-lactate dehydrogenase complex protein LldG